MRAAWMMVVVMRGAGNDCALCAPVNGLIGGGSVFAASLSIHVLIHGQIV